MDSAETNIGSGPGRPSLASSLFGRKALHSTGKQAQQWVSKEFRGGFGVLPDSSSEQNTSDIELAKDYVVDDMSGELTN